MSKGHGAVRLERMKRALDLRLAGAEYGQIGEALGVSTTQAWDDVQDALKETLREPAEKVRELELGRLNAMLLAIWPKVKAGSLPAQDRALSIMVRRSKYLGLDAPTKTAEGWMGADGELVDPAKLLADASRVVEGLAGESAPQPNAETSRS